MTDKTVAEVEKDRVQAERDSITVLNTNKAPEPDKKEDEIIDDEDEDEETVTDEVKKDLEVIEAKEKTADEIAAEKEEKKQARIERKFAKEAAEKKQLKEENEALKRQLAEKPDASLTQEEIVKQARELADKQRKEDSEKSIEDKFVDDCNKLAIEAKKIDKDFDKKVDILGKEVGRIPSQMIGMLTDLDNGGAILNHLTDDLDKAEEIFKLSPPRMALALAKLSTELSKKPVKEISKAPEPNEPLGGGHKRSAMVLNDKMPMEDWVALREKQVAERRERKLKGMRN